MQSLTIIPDVFDSKTWTHIYTTDIVDALKCRYSKFPKTGKIYHKQVSKENDITPETGEEIEELRTLPGPFYAVIAPAGVETLTYIAYALIAVVAIVAITNRPKIPNSLNRNYQTASPNNALQARTNEARVNGRIPDIYGTVRSTPDLIAFPYSIFIDHQEYEYTYMCIGRGVYDIEADTIRDGQTAVSKIRGESIEIFGPETSPNTGDDPQLRIGDPITRPVIATVRSKSVNGQTLLAPNEGSDTKNYNNLVAFVYPNKIIASSANTAPTFLDDYNIGDLIVLRTSQILGIFNGFTSGGVDEPGIGVDAKIDGNYLVRFSDAGTVEFDSSTPLPIGNHGQYLEITTGDYIGKYVIIADNGVTLTLQSPILTNANWTSLVGTTSYITTAFKHNDFIYINFTGTYELTNVEERTLTLDSPTNSQLNQSWVWMQGLDLGGGDDSFGEDGNIVTIGIGSDDDGWIGPFVLDVSTMNQVIANFIAINGLYRDNGVIQQEIDIDIQLEVTLCDDAGNALGLSHYFTTTILGSNALQSTRAQTLFADLAESGRYMVRARRLTPKDFDFVGTVVDEIKWRDVYASSPIGNIAFGNVTTVHSVTRATAQALAISERQMNMLVTRKLPVRISGNTFGDLVATNNAADIISYICLDPKIGNRPKSEVNFDNIYDTINDVINYFGNILAGEFSYTFDNDNLSFEEMITTVANAVFCTAHRRGRVIELTFEKQTEDSVLLLNHRNKVPGSETRSASFGAQNNNDGIEYDYVSPDDDAIITYYIPEDKSAVNPQKIESVGVRSLDQAYLQAYRAYNRLLYKNRVTEFDATQESEIVSINSRILVADNTRPDIQDGEIESQDGLILTLSQPAVILADVEYFIYLQLPSGIVETINISAGIDPYHVVLTGIPSEDLSLSDEVSVKTLYQIVKATDTDTYSFLLIEKEPQTNFINKLTAINYDSRYYQNDKDRLGDNADLLIQFDQSNPLQWVDLSRFERHLTINQSGGNFTNAPSPLFADNLAGKFNQAYPGSRDPIAYESSSEILAAGNINFGASDFFIDFVIDLLGVPPVAFATMCIVDNLDATTLVNGGFQINIVDDGSGTNRDVQFSCRVTSGGTKEIRVLSIPDNGPVRIQISRKGNQLSSFLDGSLQQSESRFGPPDNIIISVTRGYIRIGAKDTNVTPDLPPRLIDSFAGVMEQMYMTHGPLSGKDASFTSKTIPYLP